MSVANEVHAGALATAQPARGAGGKEDSPGGSTGRFSATASSR